MDPPVSPTRRVDVEASLRRALIRGDIAPNAWLREAALAEEYGVSRTPVREACQRLARDGLLERIPKRGFRSRPLTPAELDAAYPVLIALEVLAVESITAAGADLITELRAPELALRGERDVAELFEIDRRWHRRLVEAAGNPVVLEHHDRLAERIARYIHAYWRSWPDTSRSTADHLQIVDALERGDSKLAAAVLKSHREFGLARIRRMAVASPGAR